LRTQVAILYLIQKNTVVTTINVGQHPTGVAVSPDGTKVYVANANSSTVSVIEVVGAQCRISPCE
jgi:DNA-binding beta-propeller fold protein YncE